MTPSPYPRQLRRFTKLRRLLPLSFRPIFGCLGFLSYVSLSFAGETPTLQSLMGFQGGYDKFVSDVRKRAESNPEILHELDALPLERTFWTLREIADPRNYVPNEGMKPVARAILHKHPDLEGYFSRNLQRMNEVLEQTTAKKAQGKFLSSQESADESSAQYIVNYILYASHLPGDVAFRLVGPRVMDREWTADFGDVIGKSHCYFAADALWEMIRERLPGESVPKTLEEARAWWKANQQRFTIKSTAPAEPERSREPKPN